MKRNIDYFRIHMRYRWRIFVIHADKHFNVARITVAGWFLKLAFWVSPLVEYELSREFTPSERAINAFKPKRAKL